MEGQRQLRIDLNGLCPKCNVLQILHYPDGSGPCPGQKPNRYKPGHPDITYLDPESAMACDRADRETLDDVARSLGGEGGKNQVRLEAEVREQRGGEARARFGIPHPQA